MSVRRRFDTQQGIVLNGDSLGMADVVAVLLLLLLGQCFLTFDDFSRDALATLFFRTRHAWLMTMCVERRAAL